MDTFLMLRLGDGIYKPEHFIRGWSYYVYNVTPDLSSIVALQDSRLYKLG